MADLAKKKADTKKHIRSLLLSAPVGLTLQELQRDYALFIGGKLPSRELGYASVEEFIRDIPDTVEIILRNGTHILTGVSDASTQHIQKLVASQKLDRRKCAASGMGGTCQPRRCGVNNGRRFSKSVQNFDRGDNVPASLIRQHQHSHARHRNLPSVPAYVRSRIHEVVEKHPDGLPLPQVSDMFNKHCGVPLDYLNMGFSSVYDLLASLMDTVVMKQRPDGEIWLMSAKAGLSGGKTQNFQREHSKSVTDTQSSASPACQDERTSVKTDMGLVAKDLPEGGTAGDSQSQGHGSDFPGVDVTCSIPLAVQDNIRKVMAQRPHGIYASRLQYEYKEMFKRDLSYKACGYNSVIEFISDLGDIVRSQRPHPQGDWHLFPVHIQPSVDNCEKVLPKQQSLTDNKTVNIQVDKFTKETIYQVLCMHPDGILLESFQNIYKKMTGQALDFGSHGAHNLKQLLHSLSDLLFISLDSSDRPVVHLKVSGGPRRFDKLQKHYQPVAALEDQVHTANVHLPSDAVRPGCVYKPQELPDFDVDDGQFIDLYVSNVINPGLFWIQLRGEKTTLALEDVMDELEAVYASKRLPMDYHMPSSVARPGMICAAIYPQDGQWHRGIITGFQDHMFEVHYVDYGSTCYISISQMRLLKTKFLKFPAQSMRARLSNIRPADGVWKSDSRNRLLALSGGNPLVGLVTNVKNRVVSLCLVDTNQEEDIHINDVLVKERYAYFAPDDGSEHIANQLQVPGIELLYGESQATRKQNSVSDISISHRYIRQAQITDNIVMNLINLDGQLYILSSEISGLFFTEDIISAQLHKDNTDVPKVTVTRKEHPDLFNELAIYGASSFKDTTDALSLFPVSILPLVIEMYGKEGELDEVKDTVLEILQWFDPEDPYWKGEDVASVSDGTEDEVKSQSSLADFSDIPGLEDLQLVLKCLQIKRKRLLNHMLTADHCSPQSVNELNDIELQLKRVGNLLVQIQNVTDKPVSAQVPNASTQVNAGASQVPSASTQVNASARQVPNASTQVNAGAHQVSSASTQVNASAHQVPSSSTQVNAGACQVPSAGTQVNASARQVPSAGTQVNTGAHQKPEAIDQLTRPKSSQQTAPVTQTPPREQAVPRVQTPPVTQAAPCVQSAAVVQAAPCVQIAASVQIAAGVQTAASKLKSNGSVPSTSPQPCQSEPADIKAFLQQQIQLNSLLMNHLNISHKSQQLLLPSLGRGTCSLLLAQPHLTALMTQQNTHPVTMAAQSAIGPGLCSGTGVTEGQGARTLPKGFGRGLPLELLLEQQQKYADLLRDSELVQSYLLQNPGQSLPQNQQLLSGNPLLQEIHNSSSRMTDAGLRPSVPQNISSSQAAGLMNPTCPAFTGQQASLARLIPGTASTAVPSSSGPHVAGLMNPTSSAFTGQQASLARLIPGTASTAVPSSSGPHVAGLMNPTSSAFTGQQASLARLIPGTASTAVPSSSGPHVAGIMNPTSPAFTGQQASLTSLTPSTVSITLPSSTCSQQVLPPFSLLYGSGDAASVYQPLANSTFLQGPFIDLSRRAGPQANFNSLLPFLGRGQAPAIIPSSTKPGHPA